VLALDATRISLPGPDLDRALRELAVAVHGSGIDEAIAREQAASGDGARGERGRADGARDAEAREAVKP
jgi:hypothetical protein